MLAWVEQQADTSCDASTSRASLGGSKDSREKPLQSKWQVNSFHWKEKPTPQSCIAVVVVHNIIAIAQSAHW